MSDIVLITPPDKLETSELTFLLINPSSIIKDQFQDLISKFQDPFYVYLYEQDDSLEWLLDAFHRADIVILDIDNSSSAVRDLTSYFITKNKTYWLTNSSHNHYNLISKNRIFALDFLENIIGGNFEEAQF